MFFLYTKNKFKIIIKNLFNLKKKEGKRKKNIFLFSNFDFNFKTTIVCKSNRLVLNHLACFILGVMQATTMGGCKLEKRYSPSFRDEPQRKMSASKRKRDEILRWVTFSIPLTFVLS